MLIRAALSVCVRPAFAARRARLFSTDSGVATTGGFSFPAPRTLQQIVKLELLANEEPANISRIWDDYHADKDDAVATTLDGEAFKRLKERAKAAPYFIFPVYRQGGFFNMLCQFQDKCFLITYLEAFKENPAMAPPCVTVSLYEDLLDKKDVALLRADIVNMLDKPESEKLLGQLLKSYADKSLYEWVDKFNNRPNEFDFEAYQNAIKDE